MSIVYHESGRKMIKIAKLIDHAVLKPIQTDDDLKKECDIAKQFGVATVCVKPYNVKLAKEYLKGSSVGVGTVIGFPHGGNSTKVKIAETIEAIKDGATEIDMVVNIAKTLQGDYKYVENEIKQIVDAAHSNGALVKVIFETCYLNNEQKIKLCQICNEAKVDYVKTSTGFGTSGAMLEDIELMRKHVSSDVKIKASGGIKTLEQAEAFVKAGCQRLGLSSTKEIFEGKISDGK